MKTLIRICDFIGISPQMYILKSNRYKTLPGGILSIILAILITSAVIYFNVTLFDRGTFSVMMSESRNDFPFRNWTNEQISVILVDRYMNEIPDADRLFGYYSDAWWNKPHINETTGQVVYFNEIKRVNLEKCNIAHHFQGEEEIWRDQKLINSSMCIQRDQQLPVQYLFGDLNFTSIVFWIHRCINTTTKNDCFPKEKIEKDLENVFLQVRFKDYFMDHRILGKPYIPYVYSDMVQASSTAYKRTWYYFRNLFYESDEGFIFPDIFQHSLNSFAGTRDGTDLRTSATVPGTFAVASFYNHPLKQTYRRRYYKAQNMIADLGGIIQGLFILSQILNYLLTLNLYNLELVNFNLNNLGKIAFCNSTEKSKGSKKELQHVKNDNKNITNMNATQIDFQNTLQINVARKYKYKPITLSTWELITPPCWLKKRRRLNNLQIALKIVENQLDIREVVNYHNLVDKICYLILEDNCYMLKSAPNPLIEGSNQNFNSSNLNLNNTSVNFSLEEHWKKLNECIKI